MKKKTYRVWASVVGTKYLGAFEASSKEEAEEIAMESDEACISLCHQCSRECEDPVVDKADAEEDQRATPRPSRSRGKK